MNERVSDSEARRVFQEMLQEEIEWMLENPEMLIYPHQFRNAKRVKDTSPSGLEYVARRETEKAVERMLRGRDSTTEA